MKSLLAAVLVPSLAFASTCAEESSVVERCICGDFGFKFWLRAEVVAIDGGVTVLDNVTAASNLYGRPPDYLSAPTVAEDSVRAAFFVAARKVLDGGSTPQQLNDEWVVEKRLLLVDEQVQCRSRITDAGFPVPLVVVIDAGPATSCRFVLHDAGYRNNGCPSCGCGTDSSTAGVGVLTCLVLASALASVARRSRA